MLNYNKLSFKDEIMMRIPVNFLVKNSYNYITV